MDNQSVHLELPDVFGDQMETQPQPQPANLEQNPKIIPGFPDANTTPFSFTVSSLLVDYGIVAPTDPVTRTTNLIVGRGTAIHGYTIFAIEDHALRILNREDEIKDTTCDTGSCNEAQAAVWTNPLVFGAGVRADNIQGKTAASMFANDQNSFVQFGDRGEEESAAPIMASYGNTVHAQENGDRNDETRLLYKINIPATQKEGLYQNIINYIAVPNL